MGERSIFSPKDVFISWNHEDVAQKDRMVSWLESSSFSVWESDFECNGAIEDVCLSHVQLCKVFVVLLTERSVNSAWVRKELVAALEMEDGIHRIVPVIMSRDIMDKKQYGILDVPLRRLFDNANDAHNVSAIIGDGMESAALERKLIKNVGDLCLNRCYSVYVQNLSRVHLSVPILVNVGAVSAKGDLGQLYVPRRLKLAAEAEKEEVLTEEAFLARPGHAVIIGSGGSGKSQYLSNMASVICKQWQSTKQTCKLVFRIGCAELTRAKMPLAEYLFREFSAVVGDVNYERRHFDALLVHKRDDLLLLLDGLDEVISDVDFEQLRRNAEQFLDAHQNARLVFTTRNRRDADRMTLGTRAAEAFLLERFSEEDIRGYARSLFVAFAEEDRGEQFYIDLRSIDDEIKGNPLLVSQLAVIYADSGRLPGTVVEIFDIITELVTAAIDTRHDFLEDFAHEDRRLMEWLPDILRELSYRKYCKYADSETADNLGLVRDILERYGEPRVTCRTKAEKLLNYLERRAILYRSEFAHKMFLEYFTAVYLYESCFTGSGELRDKAQLEGYFRDHYHESYWQTVTELLLAKVDCLCTRASLRELYAVACGVSRGDYDLLFQVLRVQSRKEIICGLLLEDIMTRTLDGEYGAYAQLFCYVPRNNLYRQAVSTAGTLWGSLTEEKRFVLLSLLRDVCYLFGGHTKLEDLAEQDRLRPFQLFARKQSRSPRAALNALFCTVKPLWLEEYIASQEGSRVYPFFFNVYAVANAEKSGFGKYPLYEVFADELGLYGETEPDAEGCYWGLVSLPYEKALLEQELTVQYASAMTGLVLLPSHAPVLEQMTIANARLQVLVLPSSIRQLGRYSLAYYGVQIKQGYKLLMEYGPEELSGEHGLKYGGLLTELILPASIRRIGKATFGGWAHLERLTLPDGVTTIGEQAFSDCIELKSIHLPDTVTELGAHAFAHCLSLTRVSVGSGLRNLPDSAFWNCSGLETVELPDSLLHIGNHAFFNCTNLKTLALPARLKCIGNMAFHGCTNLEQIHIPDSVRILGEGAFENCKRLCAIDLSGELGVIGQDTFCGCESLRSAALGEGIRKIGQGAFAWCGQLKTVKLPESLTQIEPYAFSNCVALEQICLPQDLSQIGLEAFSGCVRLRAVQIPAGVRVIPSAAFAGCTALEQVALSAGLAEIWEMAFASCTSLRAIRIPVTVTEIWYAAFRGCTALQTIQVPEKTQVGDLAFEDCPGVAQSYDSLEDNITVLFGSHEQYEAYMESRTACEEIVIDGSVCPQGVLDREIAARVLPKLRFFRLRIADGVRRIAPGALEQSAAFRERLCVTEVIIGDSVTEIGDGAFQRCTDLTRAVLPRGLKQIAAGLFNSCSALTAVEVPDGVTRIGTAAFADCGALVQLELPGSLLQIGDNAFMGAGLVQMAIPVGVTQLGMWAFSDCKKLNKVTLPPSVTAISTGCFQNCPELTSVELPGGLTEIGEKAFECCEKLKHISIPHGLTLLGAAAFRGCEALETAVIPGNTTTVGEYAFGGCENLTLLTIGHGVTELGEGAFWQCEKLESVTIPGSVRRINASAFSECRDLQTVRLLPGVQHIGGFAFSQCDSMTGIELPDTVTELGEGAFLGCKQLAAVRLPVGIRVIQTMLFLETALKEVEIPDSVVFIGNSVFRGCALQRVVLPERFRDKLWAIFGDFQKLQELEDDPERLEVIF